MIRYCRLLIMLAMVATTGCERDAGRTQEGKNNMLGKKKKINMEVMVVVMGGDRW